MAEFRQGCSSSDFEIDEIIRVIHETHRIGFRIADFDAELADIVRSQGVLRIVFRG